MGQEEIKEWLCKQEKSKPGEYHTISEIGKATGNQDNVYRYVNKLYAYGYLDVKVVKYIPLLRSFRIKDKYFNSWVGNSLKVKSKSPTPVTTMV